MLLVCVPAPGGDIFTALLMETTLPDASMMQKVRNRSALEAGVTIVLKEMSLSRADLEALEEDGNAVGANQRDNEIRRNRLRGSKVIDLDRRLKKLSSMCIAHLRSCMEPKFAENSEDVAKA
jgi:hypothetical protein